jgi:hypothetical protein
VCGLLTATLLLAVPGDSGRPLVETNVRMNGLQRSFPDDQLGRAAGAVAADPEGDHLVAAWQTIRGTCGPPIGRLCKPSDPPGLTAFGYSTDGGRTWTDGGAPFVVNGAMTAGHPWLDRGGMDNRTFFLVNRARNTANVALVGATLHRGRFRDGTFTWTDGRLLSPANPGDAWRSPTLTASKDGRGAVFLAVSNLISLCGAPSRGSGQIEVLRSLDGGETWNQPVIVSPDDTLVTPDPKDPLCGSKGTTQLAPTVALGPRGEVYVFWQFGPFITDFSRNAFSIPSLFTTAATVKFRLSVSLDGGRTFSAPREVAAGNSLREDPPVGYSKDNFNDFPRIAVAMDGPHRGRIYVTYASALREVAADPTEQSLISSQVYLTRSDDRGQTWSPPSPLGPPVPSTGVKRFWPSVAVAPGGRVDIIYAESQERQSTVAPGGMECQAILPTGLFRAGKASSLVNLYRVQSVDGASFGKPVRVTTETSNWCTAFYDPGGFLEANFGDYLGIFAVRSRSFAVWTDARNGVPDAYFSALQGLRPVRSAETR